MRGHEGKCGVQLWRTMVTFKKSGPATASQPGGFRLADRAGPQRPLCYRPGLAPGVLLLLVSRGMLDPREPSTFGFESSEPGRIVGCIVEVLLLSLSPRAPGPLFNCLTPIWEEPDWPVWSSVGIVLLSFLPTSPFGSLPGSSLPGFPVFSLLGLPP